MRRSRLYVSLHGEGSSTDAPNAKFVKHLHKVCSTRRQARPSSTARHLPLPHQQLLRVARKVYPCDTTSVPSYQVDEPLAVLWQALWVNTMRRRQISVMEAELQRGVLEPRHWKEVQFLLLRRLDAGSGITRPLIKVGGRGGRAGTSGGGRGAGRAPAAAPAASEVRVPVPSAQALIRCIEILGKAAEHEATELRGRLRDARIERRKALSGCKFSPAALCKRSSNKARQQVLQMCKAAVQDWLAIVGIPFLLMTIRGPSTVW